MKFLNTLVASSCVILTVCGVSQAASMSTVSADATNVQYVIPYTIKPTWTRVYIDANKTAATGYPLNGIGVDYLVENGVLYRYSGSNGAWGWTMVKTLAFNAGATSATLTLSKADIGTPLSMNSITQTDSVNSSIVATTLSSTPPVATTTVSVDALNINYVIPFASKPTWTRVYIDADTATTSGYPNAGIGADYLIENGSLFRYAGAGGSWAWTKIKTVPFQIGASSATVSVGKADIGAPPAIYSVTQTDAPLKVSPKLTTTTTTSTPPPATIAPPTTTTVYVDYFGDSTAHGDIGGTPYQVAQPPSNVMDANLPTNYVVRNEAVGGASVIELLNGTDGVHADWKTTVSKTAAKYILMNYAINDSYETFTTPTTYKANYAKAIDIARAYGKIVILQTSNPTNNDAKTQTYVTAMKEVAAEKGVAVIDQYTYLKQYMATNNLGVYQITNDGIHPTQATYLLEGQYAARRFKEIVGIK
jgi:lysophospholipase L1-like esterase